MAMLEARIHATQTQMSQLQVGGGIHLPYNQTFHTLYVDRDWC